MTRKRHPCSWSVGAQQDGIISPGVTKISKKENQAKTGTYI